MSLEQFTDLTLKPWMNIAAAAVNAESMAIINSSGIPVIIPPSTLSTPIGTASTAQPLTTSVSYVAPYGAPQIAYNQAAYFSATAGTCAVGNGTASVAMISPVVAGLNYTSFDNTLVTIAIGGYYKIDYGANIFLNVGVNCASFQLQVVRTSVGALLNQTLAQPTFAAPAASASSFHIGGSGIVKLIAGQTYGLGYIAAISAGTGSYLASIYFTLQLIDPISA